MHIRLTLVLIFTCFSFSSQAQQGDLINSSPTTRVPEEILIIRDRTVMNLRLQMLDAEKNAYDIFNKFNDEKRFVISCSEQQATGTILKTQICQPEFVRTASTNHARDYLDYLRAERDPYGIDYRPVQASQPREFVVASQQKEYRQKIRQVAEEHPEFLEAIIRYTEILEQYKSATNTLQSEQ